MKILIILIIGLRETSVTSIIRDIGRTSGLENRVLKNLGFLCFFKNLKKLESLHLGF